jgi:hypothetical protein
VSRVFRKTALGVATFTKQETGLTQAQRGLLIMVDGKRSAGALRKFGSSFGNVNILLRELFELGLIELDAAYVEKIRLAQAEIAQEIGDLPSTLVAETVVASARPMPSAATNSVAANQSAAVAPARDLRHDLRNLGAPDPIGSLPTLSPNTITRTPLATNTVTRSALNANTIARTPIGANTITRSPLGGNTALGLNTVARSPLAGNTVVARSGPATIAPPPNRPAPSSDSVGLSLSLAPVDGGVDDAPITSASDNALVDARKFATHFVFDALGNSGTALCFAIERTETLKGLLETTNVGQKTLREMKGDPVADDFIKQLREILTR